MNELVTKERLEQAREVSRKVGYTGVSWLQRQMRVGYMTASYLLDALVEEGFCVREEGSHVYKVAPNKACTRRGAGGASESQNPVAPRG